MLDIGVVLLLVWLHFLGDFIMQSSYMAINKSKSNKVLLLHVTIYGLPFTLAGVLLGIPWFGPINAVLHFMTDWVTSRITSQLYANPDKHWFFVVIGADQAIHFTCLFCTYYWMMSWNS